MLLVCCCAPCVLAMLHFVKIYKAIELLKNLKQVYAQINFILSGSTPDAVTLFCALCDRNVFPVFCATICKKLQDGASFSEAWCAGLQDVGADSLTATEYEEVLSFAASFGLGSVDEQIRICNHFLQFCENAIAEKKGNLAKSGKLYLSGSLLFGALIFVLLF